MGKITRSLGAAAKAAADHYNRSDARPKGERLRVARRVVKCTHCESDRFDSDVNSLSGFTQLQCVTCSAIRWFAKPPKPIAE